MLSLVCETQKINGIIASAVGQFWSLFPAFVFLDGLMGRFRQLCLSLGMNIFLALIPLRAVALYFFQGLGVDFAEFLLEPKGLLF